MTALVHQLTSDLLKSYAAYMATHFKATYVHTAIAELKTQMRGAILKLNPRADIDLYFEAYAFTLGNLVWTPFNPENPQPLPRWPFDWQFITIAHEMQHVEQFHHYGGSAFAFDYFQNTESRAHYEYEAYRTALELYPLLHDGAIPDPVPLAHNLIAYGCSPQDIDYVLQQLQKVMPMIQSGAIITPAAQVAANWLRAALNVAAPTHV